LSIDYVTFDSVNLSQVILQWNTNNDEGIRDTLIISRKLEKDDEWKVISELSKVSKNYIDIVDTSNKKIEYIINTKTTCGLENFQQLTSANDV